MPMVTAPSSFGPVASRSEEGVSEGDCTAAGGEREEDEHERTESGRAGPAALHAPAVSRQARPRGGAGSATPMGPLLVGVRSICVS